MEQTSKELLLKDLCARLPYKVKVVDLDGQEFTVKGIDGEFPLVSEYNRFGNTYNTVGFGWKPYLRPMSSMTEEERKELEGIFNEYDNPCTVDEDGCLYFYGGNDFLSPSDLEIYIDFCNKNHFDYRGLIDKGLAIDATGLNIY